MRKPEIITEETKVDKIIPGGQAIATLSSGKKIFLWNALPGEIIQSIKITKNKSTFMEGIALEIAQSSPDRTDPRDECYLATSPWQIMSEAAEINTKQEILQEILRQQQIDISKLGVTPQPLKGDNNFYHYRNKMEYALYYSNEDEKIYPAFHQRSSHQKIPVSNSSLERSEIWQKATEIITELNQRKASARDYQSLLLRANQSGQVSGGLFVNRQPHPVFDSLRDQIMGAVYTYSPNGFFQINLPVYEMALLEIKKWLNDSKILDLYAGVGTIGLSIAGNNELISVECNRAAYGELENNCAGHPNATPILARSEEALEYVAPDQTIIIDPPRAGCDLKLIERFVSVTPRTIIYLSCNPVTQMRDVKMLLEKYQMVFVQPFNFFPRTPHLENLVVLERKNVA